MLLHYYWMAAVVVGRTYLSSNYYYYYRISSFKWTPTTTFIKPYCKRHPQSTPYFGQQQETTKMASSSSSSSSYHDEIKKAMDAAAELRQEVTNDTNTTTTIFDQIIAGTIPCNKVYEDEIVLAFHDVNPVAPIHILVIPKVRNGLTQISCATTQTHQMTLGHAMMVASQIGKQYCEKDGFRIVINDGEHGGQSVYHLHIHVIGGRQMQWPPG